jgi:hypothetical protein
LATVKSLKNPIHDTMPCGFGELSPLPLTAEEAIAIAPEKGRKLVIPGRQALGLGSSSDGGSRQRRKGGGIDFWGEILCDATFGG